MPTNDENQPIDAVAMHAEAIVQAALAWRSAASYESVLSRAEWQLFDACDNYGKDYRGIRAR